MSVNKDTIKPCKGEGCTSLARTKWAQYCKPCRDERRKSPSPFKVEFHPREYSIWRSMRNRCYIPTVPAYRRYGGRGITLCDRWRESFWSFYADMGDAPPGMSIDRIDNDGPYSPENCRWASPKTQSRNRGSNRLITYNGITLCLTEWAERVGLSWDLVQGRLNRGWSEHDALTTPKRDKRPALEPITWNGVTRSVEKWSVLIGGRRGSLAQRIRKGWPLEQAMTEPFYVGSHEKERQAKHG